MHNLRSWIGASKGTRMVWKARKRIAIGLEYSNERRGWWRPQYSSWHKSHSSQRSSTEAFSRAQRVKCMKRGEKQPNRKIGESSSTDQINTQSYWWKGKGYKREKETCCNCFSRLQRHSKRSHWDPNICQVFWARLFTSTVSTMGQNPTFYPEIP